MTEESRRPRRTGSGRACSPPHEHTPGPPSSQSPTSVTDRWSNDRSPGSSARGGRKVRYRGIARNRIGFAHRCAATNLRRLINLGIHWDSNWAIAN